MASDDKRTAILKAVEQMVQDRRFHEVTLDQVAQAARVSKGTIYTYFSDKEDLFFQLATLGHETLCDAIRQHAAADPSERFQDTLSAMCARIGDFFRSHHALFRVMGDHEGRLHALHATRRQAFQKHLAELWSEVAGVLARGVQRGQVRTDVPLDTQARFLVGLLYSRERAFQPPQQKPPISLLIDVFLHGVQAER